MASSVNFSVVQRKNPLKPMVAPKYYALAQSKGEKDIDEMSESIAQICTVTRPDILAVLAALQMTVMESLRNGEIARLGDLGNFRIALSGKGANTEKDYNVSLISKARILFTPSKKLYTMLKTLSYTQVTQLPVKEKQPVEEGG